MRRISSRATWWSKRVFPVVWFGFLVLFLHIVVATVGFNNLFPGYFVIFFWMCIMAVGGLMMMRWLLFPFMDEVYLLDDRMIVRNRSAEDSFLVTNIIKVEPGWMNQQGVITLTLREPCFFGREIAFCAPIRWGPFAQFTPHPLAEELRRRANGWPLGKDEGLVR